MYIRRSVDVNKITVRTHYRGEDLASTLATVLKMIGHILA